MLEILHAIAPFVGDVVRWGAIVGLAFMFRTSLTTLFAGVGSALASLANRRVKAGPFEIGPPDSTAAQSPPPAPEDTKSAIAPLVGVDTDPLLAEAIQAIANRFAQTPCEDARNKLIRELAQVAIAANFFQVYAVIYGSQLALLKYANQVTTIGVPEEIARAGFDHAVSNDPAFYAHYTFDNWIGFLTASLLLLKQPDRYVITIRGRAFLQFMVTNSLMDTGVTNNSAH
jgi:hypothetical protein